jgi:hypothetical protein
MCRLLSAASIAMLLLTASIAEANTVTIEFGGDTTLSVNMPQAASFSGWVTYDLNLATNAHYSAGFGEAYTETGCAYTLDGICEGNYGQGPAMLAFGVNIGGELFGADPAHQRQQTGVQVRAGGLGLWDAFLSSSTITRTGDFTGGNYLQVHDLRSVLLIIETTRWTMFQDGWSIQTPDPMDFAMATRREFSIGAFTNTCVFVGGSCTNFQQTNVQMFSGNLTYFSVVVPEPAATWLMCAGMVSVAAVVRRRRTHSAWITRRVSLSGRDDQMAFEWHGSRRGHDGDA